jgi:VanZ family protein
LVAASIGLFGGEKDKPELRDRHYLTTLRPRPLTGLFSKGLTQGERWLQKISRVSAWLLVLAITVLTLIPPSYRPTTEAPHSVEHLAIFLATGLAFGVGYSSRPLAIGLPLFCGVIEIAQLWVPGRHARLGDFIVDAGASFVGLGLAYFATRWPWGRATADG